MQLHRELELAMALAYEAADAIMPIFSQAEKNVETKENGTPVTIADKLANKIILEGILKAFPKDGIISEEMEDVQGDRCWYVDPIDGTKAFIKGEDQFCIMIGLALKEKPVLGVIYRPTRKIMYYGTESHGAYRKDEKSTKKMIVDSNPAITGYVGDKNLPQSVFEKYPEVDFYDMSSEGLRIMELVEASADVHYLKRFDYAGTWDICAPQAILQAAGGTLSYIDGKEIRFHGQRALENRIVAARTAGQAETFRKLLR